MLDIGHVKHLTFRASILLKKEFELELSMSYGDQQFLMIY